MRAVFGGRIEEISGGAMNAEVVDPVIFELLIGVSLAINVLTLLVCLWIWHRHDMVSGRVTRLEVEMKGMPSAGNVTDINEKLYLMNGRMTVVLQLTNTIAKHLLDKEKEK